MPAPSWRRLTHWLLGDAMAELCENAKITKVFLGREDHGIPTCFVTLTGPSWGQGFGGYDIRYYGIDMLMSIIETVGCSSWEELPGNHCRVKRETRLGPIKAIGHITDDKWYEPETKG